MTQYLERVYTNINNTKHYTAIQTKVLITLQFEQKSLIVKQKTIINNKNNRRYSEYKHSIDFKINRLFFHNY